MTVKSTILSQYQRLIDHAADQGARRLTVPPEGWLRTMRKALGMSGPQLARRMGVTRARVAKAESAELEGGITLKSMQAAAEAMGCRFVYAVVPPGNAIDVVTAQAMKKARETIDTASSHMALEDQALPSSKIEQDVSNLAQELAREMPPDFWDDK